MVEISKQTRTHRTDVRTGRAPSKQQSRPDTDSGHHLGGATGRVMPTVVGKNLALVAQQLVAPGKGILAADESTPTIGGASLLLASPIPRSNDEPIGSYCSALLGPGST